MLTPEQKARQTIDQHLMAAGWVLQDRDQLNRRLGEELGAHLLRRQLLLMTRSGLVETTGGNRNRRYALVAKNQ